MCNAYVMYGAFLHVVSLFVMKLFATEAVSLNTLFTKYVWMERGQCLAFIKKVLSPILKLFVDACDMQHLHSKVLTVPSGSI